MKRRTLVMLGVSALGLVLLMAGGAFWSISQPPAFYAEELSRPVDPVERKQDAKEFVQATLQLVDEIRHEDRWAEQFTQDQINAWLVEELPKKYARWMPREVSDPRVRFEKNAVEIAFRSQDRRFPGVISGRFEPFVAGPRKLGLRIKRIRLGLVPLPIDQVIDTIGAPLTQAVREAGGRLEWRQSDGEDVLLLERTDRDDRHELESIQVEAGTIDVAGRKREESSGGPVPSMAHQHGTMPR